MSFQETTLEKIKISVSRFVKNSELGELECESKVDELAEGLVFSLRSTITAQPLGTRTVHAASQWPADWWEHFKLRWFPGWLLRKRPVRYAYVCREIDVQSYVVYPEFVLPNRGSSYHHVRIHQRDLHGLPD